ncbi:MAG: putative protein-disulfide isomerase [Parasphingorhabdus sp.]|jgi:putative protein-disulfide isomerase
MNEKITTPFLNVYYVLDPMCSWCWAFRDSWLALLKELPEEVNIRYVLGGLAADSDTPMADSMRQGLQQTWAMIAERTGTEFNFDFWSNNTPRRSTYPACRAVISAARLKPGSLLDMVHAIQRAYYMQAKNPSDTTILCDCAESIGIDRKSFAEELESEVVEQDFQKNLYLAQTMGIQGFPAVLVVAQKNDNEKPAHHLITSGYCDAQTLVENWHRQISLAV